MRVNFKRVESIMSLLVFIQSYMSDLSTQSSSRITGGTNSGLLFVGRPRRPCLTLPVACGDTLFFELEQGRRAALSSLICGLRCEEMDFVSMLFHWKQQRREQEGFPEEPGGKSHGRLQTTVSCFLPPQILSEKWQSLWRICKGTIFEPNNEGNH